MKRFYLIFSLMLMIVLVFSGTAFASVNPFQGLTQEQVVQKYFEGRQLDTIEGIWLNDDLDPQIIIKSSLIDPDKKNGDYDYLKVGYSSTKSSVTILGISKTQYPSCFSHGRYKALLRFISPTTLLLLEGYYYHGCVYTCYTRIYPNEVNN